jgi:hypothetical protein
MRPITKPPISARINTSDPLARGLQLAYLFNEGGGGKAFDAWRRYDGTLTNGPVWTANGLKFDGSNDLVSVPSYVMGATFSFYVVLKPANITTGDNYQTIFTQNTGGGFWLRNGSGKMDLFFGGDHLNNTGLVEGQWSHFAASSVAGSVKFYLNGRADGTASGWSSGTISHIGDDTGSETFGGEIACILVWDRALTAAEIEALYADPYRMMRAAAPDAKALTGTQSGSVAESVTAADAQSATAVFGASEAETLAAADAPAATVSSQNAEAETLAPSAAQDATVSTNATEAETLTPTAAQDATVISGGSNADAETLTPADAEAANITTTGSRSETLTPADAESATVSSQGAESETLSPADAASATVTTSGSVTETVSASDSENGALAGTVIIFQELEIWIGEAGDTVAALDQEGDTRAEIQGEGESMCEVDA